MGQTFFQTTMFIIFEDILIVEKILFSPQVERSMTTSNKYDIYKLSQNLQKKFAKGLKLEDVKKLANIKKILSFCRIIV